MVCPKQTALEIFKPFVMKKDPVRRFSHNVKSASKMIDRALQGASEPAVWDMLEEVTRNHYVLLNRAPTLHRLGIQAFRPSLIEGKAIKIHPLVCEAFNADFDGDQMAVHVPLSIKAQEEARLLMCSRHNLLKPASGEPVVAPRYEIILGCFYLTNLRGGAKGEGKIFTSRNEAIMAYHNNEVHFQAKVRIRLPQSGIVDTSVGRVIFNNLLPKDMPYRNETMDKKALRRLVADVYEDYGRPETARVVDELKDIGFEYATKSGVTISVGDLTIPPKKYEIIEATRKKVNDTGNQYENGLITDQERYTKVIEQWMAAGKEIEQVMLEAQDPHNPVYQTVISGARGDITQITSMAGMKGLVANPAGKIIELPIVSNYKEGLTTLEYFISTHGARKGLTDKGLRTPDAGYLTRRLVDVAQDTVVTEADCKSRSGVVFRAAELSDLGQQFTDHLYGRVLAEDVVRTKTGKVVLKRGTLLDKPSLDILIAAKPVEVTVRSVLGCKQDWGICQQCYGLDLALSEPVKIGEAVGVIAAQSIGEPGTQLTMRTFHTGGVATEDITQGLPRVEELFEARPPKGEACLAEIDGVVEITEAKDKKIISVRRGKAGTETIKLADGYKSAVRTGAKVSEGDILAQNAEDTKAKSIKSTANGTVTSSKGGVIELATFDGEEAEYSVPDFTKFRVKAGDEVKKGDQLTEGNLNLHDLLRIRGKEATWHYIIAEVQQIYAAQAQYINDKHIEIVVREMLSKVRVTESGDTNLIPSEITAESKVIVANAKAKKAGKQLAEIEPLVLGITKASLLTDSFLSAASFQETTRILIDAAVTAQTDTLRGLKENVIIGKLIPAGTGLGEDYLYSKVSKKDADAAEDAPKPFAPPPVMPESSQELIAAKEATAKDEE